MSREEEVANAMRTEAQSSAAQRSAAPAQEASARAEQVVTAFLTEGPELSAEASEKLRVLIEAAIQERHDEIVEREDRRCPGSHDCSSLTHLPKSNVEVVGL